MLDDMFDFFVASSTDSLSIGKSPHLGHFQTENAHQTTHQVGFLE